VLTLFDELLPQWLAGQLKQSCFLKLITLFDSEAIYIVDKNQIISLIKIKLYR